MKNSDRYRAARISLVYLVIASLWIVVSDQLMAALIDDRDLLLKLSSVKDVGFVVFTAIVLYVERLNSERANSNHQNQIELAERKYRDVFDTAPIGIFQSTADGRYTGANRVFAQMLGYDTAEELTANTLSHDASLGQPDNIFADMTRAASKRLQYERQFRCKDGHMIDALVNIRLVSEGIGTPPYLEGFVENITERKVAERKIVQMADIVRSSQDAIYSVTPDNLFTSWNPAATHIYGYTQAEIEGKSSTILFPPERLAERARLRELVFSGQSISQYETVHVRKDGSRLNVSLTYSPIVEPSGKVTGVSAIVRDITERTQIMARLEEQQNALRAFAHRLIESQEEERKRLSRELHDETLQDLVALAQRAELSHTALDRDQAVAGRRLDELQTLAKDMIVKMRRISNDLRPLVLEDLGIAAAIQYLADELANQMPAAAVQCAISGNELRLDPDVEITTFRIVQQAMHNVRLHAPDSSVINVQLTFLQNGVEASVSDNGPGFNFRGIDEMVRQGHLGLAGMIERARLLGGQVLVASNTLSGTRITMRLPYVPAPLNVEMPRHLESVRN
ncbi:MAG TPA: PAS domain S-box protein [Anaerolineae bacterium]|jgi:PAS domain S-box-containing protein